MINSVSVLNSGVDRTGANGHPSESVREKLYQFLRERPAGADAVELTGLLFQGRIGDRALAHRLIDGLIGRDPNFHHDTEQDLWSLSDAAAIRVPLNEAEFVVVDLETLGGPIGPGAIIEIGAYRMRGQRMVESFASLVRPAGPVPRFITRLTSITNEMVEAAPPIEQVMPAFRDFLGKAVMVAHNAQFDSSFIDFEFRRLFGIRLMNPVMCTIRMARRLLPSLKRRRLDLLAEHFGLSTEGRHRALGDARMTAELLSIFLEMSARMGVDRLDRLIDTHARGVSGRRMERHVPPEVIAALPREPGVYLMRNQRGDLLYIGKAASLRNRVASYFNGGLNLNSKTAELVSHVWEIETLVTRSSLEAAIEEARLIREHKPPYNRMLKAAASTFVIKVDLDDPFPRIQVARKLTAKSGVMQLGPFIGRRNLDHSVQALSRVLGLRVCSGRIEPDPDFSPCIYGQIGNCSAPCNLTSSQESYGAAVNRALSFLRGRSGRILGELAQARDQAGAAMRFEEARRHHRALEALAALTRRAERLSRVIAENNLIIVTGEAKASAGNDTGTRDKSLEGIDAAGPNVYVILSGRLSLKRTLDSCATAQQIAEFAVANFDRYRTSPVTRDELEPMMIVARWLAERSPSDGRLIYLPEVPERAWLARQLWN
jgi:DNA polymerase-3 subunit epsilon